MISIDEYILLPKEERQAHLKLDEACIERGGMSTYCKGLLAHIHDTTIPSGKKIHVCHACNNSLCSNPAHLYWGTSKENRNDYVATGQSTSVWERTVAKYGIDDARMMMSRSSASDAGKGNKGKTKSPEHRQKIADAIKLKHASKKLV